MKDYCDWCFFYKDMMTFSMDFNKLTNCSSTFKMVDVFDLFFRISNYQCTVNIKVVDDFFDLLPIFNHACL